MTGFLGFSSGYFAMENCDTLLMLGTDFPYRQFYPKHARVAQVDVRPEALGNRTPHEVGLLGDVSETIKALLPKLEDHDNHAHLDDALANYKTARKDLDALAEEGKHGNIIHPQYVTRIVSEVAAEDAIITCDVGTPTAWAARYPW